MYIECIKLWVEGAVDGGGGGVKAGEYLGGNGREYIALQGGIADKRAQLGNDGGCKAYGVRYGRFAVLEAVIDAQEQYLT